MSTNNNIDIENILDTLQLILKSIPTNKKSSNVILVTSLAGMASVGIYKLVDYLNKKN